jgi:hypothetical protein
VRPMHPSVTACWQHGPQYSLNCIPSTPKLFGRRGKQKWVKIGKDLWCRDVGEQPVHCNRPSMGAFLVD